MKNFICIIVCGILIFSLNGCKKNVLDSSPEISTEMDGVVSIHCKDEKYKGKIIFDKCIEYLFLHTKNLYWFINDYSMYEDLTELLNHSDASL